MLRYRRLITLGLWAALLLSACAPTTSSTPLAVRPTSAASPTTITKSPTAVPVNLIVLHGAGSTLQTLIMLNWGEAYPFLDPSIAIDYQSIGSGGGKQAIAKQSVDFAASDSLLTTEYTSTPGLQMFPILASAIGPIVNLAPDVTKPITLDGLTLAKIYSGQITRWNDPALQILNPDLKLPDKPITAIHRSDSSGTTEAFTKYLAAVSADWKNGPGSGTTVKWPVDQLGLGLGESGNAGIAIALAKTPYAIGYIDLPYAIADNVPFANMINAAGQKVSANATTIASAMTDFGDAFDARLTVASISNGFGQNSWPIVAYTYHIIYRDWQPDAALGCVKVGKYLNWVHWFLVDTEAAGRATRLGYIPLPDSIRAKVLNMLATVTCGGKSISSDINK
jgi:phosphate transport system substrate-binding protein